MAKALIIMTFAALGGCATTTAQLNQAAVVTGQTQARFDFPDLPPACTAHVDRVVPKVGEKARWTQNRWEITAESRDQLANDCRAWGMEAKQKYGGRGT